MPASTDRAAMSRGLALLFGAGATFVGITLVLPHRSGEAHATLLIPAGLAYVVAAALVARPQRFSPTALHAILAAGTVLVGLCVLFSGRAGSAYAFMYVWVALYAAAFFSARATVAHLAWLAGTYAVALAISGRVHPPPANWLLAAGTSTVAAALILQLTREIRGRAHDLSAVTQLANELGSASEVSADSVATAVCDAVVASTGGATAVLLAPVDEPRAPFDTSAGIAAVGEALRTGRAVRLAGPTGARGGSTIVGLVQPVPADGRVAGVLAIGWDRPRRRISPRVEASIALIAAEAGVGLERVGRQSRERERRALELNDEIVQGLVVATYALREGRVEIGEQAVADTLERARALVEAQLQALHGKQAPEPGALRREGRGIG